jgi:hypothetical protein
MPSYAHLETLFAIKQAILHRGPVAASIEGSSECFTIIGYDDKTETFMTTSTDPAKQKISYSQLNMLLAESKIGCSVQID